MSDSHLQSALAHELEIIWMTDIAEILQDIDEFKAPEPERGEANEEL